MQLSDSKVGRWLALSILILMFLIIYFLFFHWFFVEHGGLDEQMSDLEESRQKYTNMAARIPQLRKSIQDVNAAVGENDKFLNSDTANLANAEITSILKGIVNANVENAADCQILSQTPTKDRDPEQFEKIILRVRMRCQYNLAVKIMMAIEENTPYLFLDEFRLEQRNVRRTRRNVEQTEADKLEIRFDLYAYLDNPIVKKDEK
ncbi:type II secretion system protein GspM [Marinicella sp. W31]|uniref:type II secretion system protein GspM n=1 Tax=Marinicella sp. W31 TaxID=3023713 RepID=UPI00375781A4